MKRGGPTMVRKFFSPIQKFNTSVLTYFSFSRHTKSILKLVEIICIY